MTTVADIIKFMNTLAPPEMASSWDRVGLNCGHTDRPVKTVLIALDPFRAVCQEAKELGADLLITHHALLWDQAFVTDQDETGRNTLFLIENGIAHFNAHTNLDCAPGGVNDVLAHRLGLADVQVITPEGTDANGDPWGLLRAGEIEPQPLSDFLALVKERLGCKGLRYADGGKPVHKVAVGGGSCGDGILETVQAGCDTFVTADIKYNQFWEARNLGLNLIDAGHYYTENPVCAELREKITAAFPELTVKVSEKHRDCMNFF